MMVAQYRIRQPDELKAFIGSMAWAQYEMNLRQLCSEWEERKEDRTFTVQLESEGRTAGLYVYDGMKKKKVCTVPHILVYPILQKVGQLRSAR